MVVIHGVEILETAMCRALTVLLVGSEVEQAIMLETGEGPTPADIPPGVKFFSFVGADA